MEGYNLVMIVFNYEVNTIDKPDQYVQDSSQPMLTVNFDYAEHHKNFINSLEQDIDTPIHHSIKKEEPDVSRFILAEFKSDEDDWWKEYLYNRLDSLNVDEEDQNEIVEKIIEVFNKEIETLNADNDRKILAFSIDMKLTHILVSAGIRGEDVEEHQYGENQKRRKTVGESESCSICFEEFSVEDDDVFCMPCSHVFDGKECIEKWLRGEDNCPVC